MLAICISIAVAFSYITWLSFGASTVTEVLDLDRSWVKPVTITLSSLLVVLRIVTIVPTTFPICARRLI